MLNAKAPLCPEIAYLLKASQKNPFSKKDISLYNVIGLVQLQDKIVDRCALTIYPYSLDVSLTTTISQSERHLERIVEGLIEL
jgi:hypothetical protein